jgi:hypothetical protein
MPPLCRFCLTHHDRDMTCAALEELAAREDVAIEEINAAAEEQFRSAAADKNDGGPEDACGYMTVGDLIDLLSRAPRSMRVRIATGGGLHEVNDDATGYFVGTGDDYFVIDVGESIEKLAKKEASDGSKNR